MGIWVIAHCVWLLLHCKLFFAWYTGQQTVLLKSTINSQAADAVLSYAMRLSFFGGHLPLWSAGTSQIETILAKVALILDNSFHDMSASTTGWTTLERVALWNMIKKILCWYHKNCWFSCIAWKLEKTPESQHRVNHHAYIETQSWHIKFVIEQIQQLMDINARIECQQPILIPYFQIIWRGLTLLTSLDFRYGTHAHTVKQSTHSYTDFQWSQTWLTNSWC